MKDLKNIDQASTRGEAETDLLLLRRKGQKWNAKYQIAIRGREQKLGFLPTLTSPRISEG